MSEELLPAGECCEPKALTNCARPLSIEEKLVNRQQRLQGELNEVTSALDALRGNPEVSKLLTLVNNAMRH